MKDCLKRLAKDHTLKGALNYFIFSYNNLYHTTIKLSPMEAELETFELLK